MDPRVEEEIAAIRIHLSQAAAIIPDKKHTGARGQAARIENEAIGRAINVTSALKPIEEGIIRHLEEQGILLSKEDALRLAKAVEHYMVSVMNPTISGGSGDFVRRLREVLGSTLELDPITSTYVPAAAERLEARLASIITEPASGLGSKADAIHDIMQIVQQYNDTLQHGNFAMNNPPGGEQRPAHKGRRK